MLPILSISLDRGKTPGFANLNLKTSPSYPTIPELLQAALDYFKVPGFDMHFVYTVDPFIGSVMIRIPLSHLLQALFYHELSYPEIFVRS